MNAKLQKLAWAVALQKSFRWEHLPAGLTLRSSLFVAFGNQIIDMHWMLIFFACFLHADDLLDIAKEWLGSSLSEGTQFTVLSGLTNKSYLFDAEEKSM